MKKIFTLFAGLAIALSASAQNEWKASGAYLDANSTLVDNDLLKITAISAAKGGEEAQTICGVEFSGWFQLRTDKPDPTPDAPTPGVQADCSGIQIEAKANVDLSAYYRRQKGSNGHDAADNKDILCMNTTTGASVTDVITFNDEAEAAASYAYVKGTFSLTPGSYILYRRGSTVRVFGFTWEAGTPAGVNDIIAEDAPVEYFNLQGVRVENPSNGLFIKRQGSKVSKVVVK